MNVEKTPERADHGTEREVAGEGEKENELKRGRVGS
jgi:hypothetical protein